jgi:hypothetical protein
MLILLGIDVNAIPIRKYRRFARSGEGVGRRSIVQRLAM